MTRTFESRLPFRRVFELKPDLSHARNRVISEATGDYIVSSDVTVCPEWLTEYVIAFRTWPSAGVFGRPIEPWFDGTPMRRSTSSQLVSVVIPFYNKPETYDAIGR